jgi:predicted transcriptional regulator
MMSKTMAEVMSRNQTIAVGGTRLNRSLAMAAPNCTETIPVTTSHAAGIRFVTRTEPLCQTWLRQQHPSVLDTVVRLC